MELSLALVLEINVVFATELWELSCLRNVTGVTCLSWAVPLAPQFPPPTLGQPQKNLVMKHAAILEDKACGTSPEIAGRAHLCLGRGCPGLCVGVVRAHSLSLLAPHSGAKDYTASGSLLGGRVLGDLVVSFPVPF